MVKRKRKVLTDEFKGGRGAAVPAGGRTIRQGCEELDLGETALRSWVKRAQDEVAVDL